jgi:hypothetical protein
MIDTPLLILSYHTFAKISKVGTIVYPTAFLNKGTTAHEYDNSFTMFKPIFKSNEGGTTEGKSAYP